MKLNFAFLVIIIFFSSCHTEEVEKGHHGLVFKRFSGGIDETKIFNPGKYKIANWNYLRQYKTDQQTIKNELSFNSKGSFKIYLSYTYSFQISPQKIGVIHSLYGNNFSKHINSLFNGAIWLQLLHIGVNSALISKRFPNSVQRLGK